MAFAAPALDKGFGFLPSLIGMLQDAGARLQSFAEAAAQMAESLLAVFAKSFDERLSPPKSRAAATEQRSNSHVIRPMTLADQWSKISAVLVRSVDGARIATEMQSAATQQLDLAQYGLITLVDELSAVMNIPGRHSRSATVHAFNSAFDGGDVFPSKGRALAA